MKTIIMLLFLITFLLKSMSQDSETLSDNIKNIQKKLTEYEFKLEILKKQIDDVLWFNRMSDISYVDKVLIYGPPKAKVFDTTKIGWNNPVRFWAYVFIPKNIKKNKKYPLIVFPHGGVHADFSTYHFHIVRELIIQGYIIIAPEYRGSSGYGNEFRELIDYGGKEIDDVDASRKYMIENYDFVDSTRVGVFGWSHGGLIALMCLFFYPQHYVVGFAGVPVSDLILRISYHGIEYEKYFSAPYHIGQTVSENPEEYKRRSPAYHAEKLQRPVLIHANTNDDDVYAIEVLQLVDALQKAQKEFVFDLYENLPGGHSFDRLDTKLAREIRFKTYSFIAKYLKPPYRYKSSKDLSRNAYPGLK